MTLEIIAEANYRIYTQIRRERNPIKAIKRGLAIEIPPLVTNEAVIIDYTKMLTYIVVFT